MCLRLAIVNRISRAIIRLSAVVLLAATTASAIHGQQESDSGFSSPEAVAQRLAGVREEQAQLAKGKNRAEELQALRQLEAALVQHREALDYLDQVKRESEAIEKSVRAWSGLDSPPPFSIRFVDRLRGEFHALERQLADTESRLRIIARVIDQTNSSLAAHQGAARQYRENKHAADSHGAQQEAGAAERLEILAARTDAEALARLQLRYSAHEVQQGALTGALELAGVKLEAVKGRVEFTRVELDEIKQQLSSERSALLSAALSDGIEEQSRQITWKIDILDIERDFWDAAWSAINAVDTTEKDQALEILQRLQARIDDWVELIRLQAGEAIEEDVPTIGARTSVDEIRYVVDLQHRIMYTRESLGDQSVSLTSLLDYLEGGLQAIWGMELYLAEEKRSVAGEKIITYSAVTLGKILRLAFILAVGWGLLRFLARQLRALLLHRLGSDPARAEMVRSWTFGIGLMILLIYGLNRVHIPFTAFAFLGGTLAIGIGFGAQTLLKNFISGVILSLERPFKVGDLIEVDDILGNIERIGLRASVIRHFDGTDTLVPNSTLLENRVSNWTFGDDAMRDRIEVSIAYGSPTHEVKRALLSVAESHGLVLDDPAPSVQFREFGDNALDFSLLYWFDAVRIRPEVIASDLRFMVDNAFRESGIVIAFPQRDIHFDSQPLKVELTQPQTDSE